MNDYPQREASWEDGYPVEFYRFVRENDFWRYNTSDRILTRDVADEAIAAYTPLPIRRERISQGSERNKLQLTVTIPRDADVTQLWRPFPTSQPVGLAIFGGHVSNEPDDDNPGFPNDVVQNSSVVWLGRVVSPKFRADTVTLLCEPSTTLARKSGQSQCWQRGCMHVLYKQGHGLCNADPNAFKRTATVTYSSSINVDFDDLSSFPNGRLAGGYLEWVTDEGNTERRSVNAHDGDSVIITYGSIQLPVGTEVTLYPGCLRTYEDCSDYFNNGDNYGGDLYSPQRSPFNGLPVF